MTDDELRVAIAEACPTVKYRMELYGEDPLEDLNAMHEAVTSRKDVPGFMKKYNHMLAVACVVSGSRVRNSAEEFKIVNATARQRAEAFGRTLWPEKFISYVKP